MQQLKGRNNAESGHDRLKPREGETSGYWRRCHTNITGAVVLLEHLSATQRTSSAQPSWKQPSTSRRLIIRRLAAEWRHATHCALQKKREGKFHGNTCVLFYCLIVNCTAEPLGCGFTRRSLVNRSTESPGQAPPALRISIPRWDRHDNDARSQAWCVRAGGGRAARFAVALGRIPANLRDGPSSSCAGTWLRVQLRPQSGDGTTRSRLEWQRARPVVTLHLPQLRLRTENNYAIDVNAAAAGADDKTSCCTRRGEGKVRRRDGKPAAARARRPAWRRELFNLPNKCRQCEAVSQKKPRWTEKRLQCDLFREA